MKKRDNQASGSTILIASLLGLVALIVLVGLTSSLVVGLIGSLMLAAGTAMYFQVKIAATKLFMIVVGIAVVGVVVAYAALGVDETWKRSCVPEGDCAARHQFTSLERLDHDVFGLYTY